jgi:hypothetical protein
MRITALLLSMTLCGSAAAQSWQPDFNASAFKGPVSGPANEVLVLGSPHLSQLPNTFQAASLTLLNERLAAWKPQAIAIEAVSGPQCDFMRRYPARYKDSIGAYCRDPAPARLAMGLDVAAATEAAEAMLAAWPAAPTPAQRRRLAALFFAGGEEASALVQWLRLPEGERRAGDGLDAALVGVLVKLETRRDESLMIGARLAARLGLERLYAMDDHTADSASEDQKAFGDALMTAWDNPATKQRTAADKAQEGLLASAEGVLAMYRADNAPGQAALIYRSDFGAAINEPSAQRFGRQYVGYWETRNLRMAANIRDVLGMRPGQRMLVIVGASHKGYLESYLHQMHDVRIVDAARVLK